MQIWFNEINSHIEPSEHGLVNVTMSVMPQNKTRSRSITFRGVMGYFFSSDAELPER